MISIDQVHRLMPKDRINCIYAFVCQIFNGPEATRNASLGYEYSGSAWLKEPTNELRINITNVTDSYMNNVFITSECKWSTRVSVLPNVCVEPSHFCCSCPQCHHCNFHKLISIVKGRFF